MSNFFDNPLLLLVLVVGVFGLFVVALLGAIRSRSLTEGQRVAWVVVIVVMPFLGPILWFAAGRSSGQVVGGTDRAQPRRP